MSYLLLQNGIPDFSQLTISFWFRVPAKSLAAAAAQPYTGARLQNILPLVVWGPELTGYTPIHGPSYVIGSYTVTGANKNPDCSWGIGSPILAGQDLAVDYIAGPIALIDQSYIGILCQDNGDGTFSNTLKVHIQMKDLGKGENIFLVTRERNSNYIEDEGAYPFDCPDPQITLAFPGWVVGGVDLQSCWSDRYYPGGEWTLTGSFDDFTGIVLKGNVGEVFNIGGTDACSIQPDQWNHVLLSLDLSKPINVIGGRVLRSRVGCEVNDYDISISPGVLTTDCRAYLALNDKNLMGGDLNPNNNVTFLGEGTVLINQSGPNAIATDTAYFAAASANEAVVFDKFWQLSGVVRIWNFAVPSAASFEYTPSMVPAAGYAFGIPGTPSVVDNIHKVEMAEFQMFTSGVIDTGIEHNRRMFISAKGMPVDPALVSSSTSLPIGDPTTWEPGADIVPVIPSDPNAPIGKRGLGKPIVSLTRTNQNWITPLNLGSARGRFTRTGKIKPFRPEPQLGK